MHTNACWGVDPFGDLPPAWTVALIALAALGFVPRVADPAGRRFERAAQSWHARPALALGLVSLATGALCFAVTDPVRLVGDSTLRLGLLGLNLPPERLLPQVFPLDAFINAHLPRALIVLGMSGETALRLVGAAMAALYSALLLGILRESDEGGSGLVACALLALTGGVLLVFPGYDKFGPLVVGVALAMLGALRLSRGKGGAWALAGGCATAVLSHRTGYLLLPAAIWVFLQAGRSQGDRAGAGRLIPPALFCLGVALATVPRALEVLRLFDVPVQRSAIAAAATTWAPGLMALRLVDALNATFFYVPWWPVALVAAVLLSRRPTRGERVARGARRFTLAPAAAIVLGLQSVVLVAIRPPQGAGRDWDMNAGFGTVLTIVTCVLLARAARRFDLRRLWAPLVSTMVVVAISQWCLVAVESVQLKRVDGFLTRRPAWSPEQRATTLDFLGLRAFNLARFEDSARYFERAIEVEPNPRFFFQAGLAYWRAGQPAQARVFAMEAARRAPRIGDPWWVLAAAARAQGDSAYAAACLDSAHARGSRYPPAGM